MTLIETIYNLLSSLFIILILLILFFGQNWQVFRASRQIRRSLKDLEQWRKYGIKQLIKLIEPLTSETVTEHDIKNFISEVLDYFAIPLEELKTENYNLWSSLLIQQQHRFKEMIKSFIPKISELTLYIIIALINATREIDSILKKGQHNLTIGEKTNGYWYLLQTASEITQAMLKARRYRILLDSLLLGYPIGDSIGPLSIKELVNQISEKKEHNQRNVNEKTLNDEYISQEIQFEGRTLICLRTKGPEPRVGHPSMILREIVEKLSLEKIKISMILSIDAYAKLEVEQSGTISQGLGIVVGGDTKANIEKFLIEEYIAQKDPSILLEAIICRESVEEAVFPMTDQIKNSIPKIIRNIKTTIRNQTTKGDTIIIIGIGNSLGIL
ncbi:DUF1512 family protein [Candidatus Harpocratesius sp.]